MGGSVLKAAIAGLLVCTAGLASAQTAADGKVTVLDGLVLRNISVVDTRSGEISEGMAVVIRYGKISAVASDADVEAGPAVDTVDASGKFAVPGYMDMHAHAILPPAEGADASSGHSHGSGDNGDQSNYWRLMVANGITGFRQMSGSAAIIKAGEEINAARTSGQIIAPEVLQVTGDIYLGQAPTPDAAAQFVKAQFDAGADFLKIIAGPRAGVLASLAEAKRLDMDVSGHLPDTITTEEAVKAGWDSFDHLGAGWGFMLDCANAEPAIRQKLAEAMAGPPLSLPQTFLYNPMLYTGNLRAPAYQAILATYNPQKCEQIASLFADNNVWQVPTLIRIKTMDSGGDAEFRNDENLKYIKPAVRAIWQRMGAEFEQTITPENAALFKQFYQKQLEVTGMLKDRGVRILAGTDVGGIWVIPGFSLHQEFAELSEAGFTSLEVLQATTINAAAFLEREDTLGTVEAGKVADLVILNSDPIADYRHLNDISAVVLNGKYISTGELESMKASVASAYLQ